MQPKTVKKIRRYAKHVDKKEIFGNKQENFLISWSLQI